MKCIVWGIQSIPIQYLSMVTGITKLNSDDHLKFYRSIESPCCRSVILQKHTKD